MVNSMRKTLLPIEVARIWIFLISPFTFAEVPAVIIEKLNEGIYLNSYLEVLADPELTLTYEQVVSEEHRYPWLPVGDKVFSSSKNKSRYWFRFKVRFSPRALKEEPILYVNQHISLIHRMVVWTNTNDLNDLRVRSGGNAFPFEQQEIFAYKLGFHLPQDKNEYTVVGRIDNSEINLPALLPLMLTSKSDYETREFRTQLIMAGFYSVLFALLFYNLALLLSLRDKLYAGYIPLLLAYIRVCRWMEIHCVGYGLPCRT